MLLYLSLKFIHYIIMYMYIVLYAVNLGRLEAIRVSSEGEIGSLRGQVSRLQQTVTSLERERDQLTSSQSVTNESQAKRLRSLQQVSVHTLQLSSCM